MVKKEIEDMDIDETNPIPEPVNGEKDFMAEEEEETYGSGGKPDEDGGNAKPPVKAGKYRAFSVIFFLLTAGGLFLGLLGKYIPWLTPSYYHGNSGLNNSLLGFFLTRMQGIFSAPLTAPDIFAVLAALLLLVTVLISAVTLIVSLVSARRAKSAAAVSGTVSLLTYTLSFMWAICVNSLKLPAFSAEAVDMPVAVITLLLFAFMTVFAVLEYGKAGFFGAGIYLFSVVSCFALFFPGSFTESHFSLLETFSANPVYNSVVLVTVAAIIAMLVVSVLGFLRKNRGKLITVFSSVQLAAVLLLCVAGSGLGKNWSLQFFRDSSLLPSIVLIFASLGSLLFSCLILAVQRKARRLAEEEEEEEEDEESLCIEDEEDDTDAAEEENPEEQEEETESEPAEEAEIILPEETETGCAEEACGECVTEEETSAVAAEEISVPEKEMSAFEREMLMFAEKGTEAAGTEEESIPAAAPYTPPAPTFRPINVYTDPSMQYVYDPFINELTPEEKNEFGDLFIACKSGKYGDLPVYHIGGDNREFFDKVWIRYGLYEMSANLRDKLFNYLKRYRSKQQ